MDESETITQRPATKPRRGSKKPRASTQASSVTEPPSQPNLSQVSDSSDEQQFWTIQAPKYAKILACLKDFGIPYIRLKTTQLPSRLQTLLQNLPEEEGEEYRNTIRQTIMQIAAGYIEGHPRTTTFKLAMSVQSFLESLQLTLEFEWVFTLVDEISEVKDFGNQPSQKPYDLASLFQTLSIQFNNDDYPLNEIVGGPQAFVIKNPFLLAEWLPISQVYRMRKLRRFLRKIVLVLTDLMAAYDQGDYIRCSELFVQFSRLKRDWPTDDMEKQTSPDQSHLETPQCHSGNSRNKSKSKSKSNLASQGEKNTLKRFFKPNHVRFNLPSVSEFNGSIFKSFNALARITPEFNEEQLLNFVSSLTGPSYERCSDIPLLAPMPKPETGIPRKKYYQVFDSMKELKGQILVSKGQGIRPRNPFKKISNIDYDQESEEEVQEALAEVCDSATQSSTESDSVCSEDQEFIIHDQILNQDLFRDYGMRLTYNQLHSMQVTTGDYNQFHFLLEDAKTPELQTFFNRYCITKVEEAAQFPLPIRDHAEDPLPKSQQKKSAFLDNDANFIEMLLWVNGRKENKNTLATEFKITQPKCSKASFLLKFNDSFQRMSNNVLQIKQNIIDKYDLSRQLEEIRRSQEILIPLIQINPPTQTSNFLTGGKNLFSEAGVVTKRSVGRPSKLIQVVSSGKVTPHQKLLF